MEVIRISERVKKENFSEELKTYLWKTDKDGNLLDEPMKYNDYAMHAMRYAIWGYKKKKYALNPNIMWK
ncbi:MAG TPA: hypothetical protein DIS94_10890 [Bacteroidetes bacterium]|nr:hypothetical protein [Bacteroidota bacterium]